MQGITADRKRNTGPNGPVSEPLHLPISSPRLQTVRRVSRAARRPSRIIRLGMSGYIEPIAVSVIAAPAIMPSPIAKDRIYFTSPFLLRYNHSIVREDEKYSLLFRFFLAVIVNCRLYCLFSQHRAMNFLRRKSLKRFHDSRIGELQRLVNRLALDEFGGH